MHRLAPSTTPLRCDSSHSNTCTGALVRTHSVLSGGGVDKSASCMGCEAVRAHVRATWIRAGCVESCQCNPSTQIGWRRLSILFQHVHPMRATLGHSLERNPSLGLWCGLARSTQPHPLEFGAFDASSVPLPGSAQPVRVLCDVNQRAVRCSRSTSISHPRALRCCG